jgi:anti-sigma factor RsiW
VNKTSPHISFAWLADLVDGRLGDDEQAETAAHLAACPQCAANLAWLERVLGLMRDDTARDAPPHAIAAAKRIFDRSRQAPAPVRKQLNGTLRFDSRHATAPAGVRTVRQPDRQMLFAAAEFLLELRIAASGPLWIISGQLLGDAQAEQVELRGPAWMSQTPLNDVSEFMLPPAPSGNYTLTVQLSDLDITIAGLELGA